MLDNGLLRVTIDARGLVTSLRRPDRRTARSIAPGAAANLLQLHPDLPNQWDAWDVDAFYRNTATDLRRGRRARSSTRTPGRQRAVRVARTFGASTVDPDDHAAHRAAPRSTSTPRSTGTRREKFLKAGVPARRPRRPRPSPRSSSGTSPGRPTRTPVGGGQVRDRAPTAGCTSASPATASRSSTTRPTATTSPARRATGRRHDDDRAAVAAARAALPGPGDRPGRRIASGTPSSPAPTSPDAIREGYAINLPERRVPGRGAGRAAGAASTDAAASSRRSSWPTTGSGDVDRPRSTRPTVARCEPR